MLAMLVAATAFGCNEASDETQEAPFVHPTPTPYQPDGETAVEPTLTPQHIATLSPELVLVATAFDGAAVLAFHNELLALADDSCPAITTVGNSSVWYGNCTTAGGTTFDGGVRLDYLVDSMQDGGIINGFTLGTEGQLLNITAADGRSIRASFYLGSQVADYDGEIVHSVYYNGEIKMDAASAAGNPWFNGDVSGAVSRYASSNQYGSAYGFGGAFSLAGSSWQDAGVSAVSFAEFALLDFGCPGVQGALDVRDLQGAWHRAAFAPTEDATDEQLCNSCGDLFFQKELLGEFCSQPTVFENILNWEITPW